MSWSVDAYFGWPTPLFAIESVAGKAKKRSENRRGGDSRCGQRGKS